MKSRYVNILWGLILIFAGGLFMAANLGYILVLSSQFWMVTFAGVSALFFVLYFLSGVHNWGLLFPACIFGGVALTMGLVELGVTSSALGVPVLLGLAVPFIVEFTLDVRKNWWALIPTWVFAVLTLIVLITDFVPGEVIGSLVIFAVAVPFLVVYLVDRSRTWALIPTVVLTAVSLIPLIALQGVGEFIGSFVLFVIAAPFFVVFFWSQKNWWALIPAGITSSIAFALLVVGVGDLGRWEVPLLNGIIFLGWAATFAVLWLRRATEPTDWAIYPAVCLAGAAVLAFLLSTSFNAFWPLALIAGGTVVLIFTLRPRKVA